MLLLDALVSQRLAFFFVVVIAIFLLTFLNEAVHVTIYFKYSLLILDLLLKLASRFSLCVHFLSPSLVLALIRFAFEECASFRAILVELLKLVAFLILQALRNDV